MIWFEARDKFWKTYFMVFMKSDLQGRRVASASGMCCSELRHV